MALLVLDRYEEDRMIRERRASGNDRYDEVWDGTYVMSPLADVEHQQLSFKLAWVFQNIVGPDSPAIVTAGVNVSDRDQGWLQNYRIPDASVTLDGSHALHRGTHFVGGPDFLVEIVSDDDRSREK